MFTRAMWQSVGGSTREQPVRHRMRLSVSADATLAPECLLRDAAPDLIVIITFSTLCSPRDGIP